MKVKSQSVKSKTYLFFDILLCRAGFGQCNSTVGGATQCDAAEIQYKPSEKQNVLQLIVAGQNKTPKSCGEKQNSLVINVVHRIWTQC